MKIQADYRQITKCGAVVAQWIRPQTLNCEVPGLNLLAAAVVPLGKALLLSLPCPSERT